MRVLHVVPSYYPAIRYGGPTVSVRMLCKGLASCGIEVDVATTDADGQASLDVPTDRWIEMDGTRVRYFPRSPKIGFAPSMLLAKTMRDEAGNYDLIHVNGIWTFPALAAGVAARRARVPYVIAPRGCLEPWSLTQKRWKKWPYWRWIERSNMKGAAAIHATADSERDSVRALLPDSCIFVSPNAVEQISIPAIPRHPRQIVFLGRVHRKKGFDVLVPALARVAEVMPDVETIVAGPDDEGEWARVQDLLANVRPRPRMQYVGTMGGDSRWELLASSAVFVLPSHSENFGVAVVEAMACGTPVVVSRNCPWRSVEERGAGFWVENTAENVASSILAILQDEPLAKRMGAAGVELAAEYSSLRIGQDMARHYHKILSSQSG